MFNVTSSHAKVNDLSQMVLPVFCCLGNRVFNRQITRQWCCQWGRPVLKEGNRVQDMCKRFNWGALDLN